MFRSSIPSLAVVAVIAIGSSLGAGCRSDTSVPPSAPEASAGGATHASAGVVPGSHEDWCAEHAVPESMCTRCNASLIPAFKATNDWCAEHALPESQCLKCNPSLVIARPARTE